MMMTMGDSADQRDRAGGPSVGEIDRRLIEAFAHQRVVVFLGAGVSIGAGHPSWNQLVSVLASELGIEPDVGSSMFSPRLLLGIPQYYENMFGKRDLALAIERAVGRNKASSIHDRIATLPCNLFYTTNFDELLEESLGHNGVEFDVIASDVDARFYGRDHNRCQVRKLHGTIRRPDTLVITRTDFARYTRDHPTLNRTLGTDFTQYTFLFLGYSLSDPDFNSIYDEVFYDSAPYNHKHFILIEGINDHERADLRGRGLEPIPLELWPGDSQTDRLEAFLAHLEGEASEVSHIGNYFPTLRRQSKVAIVVPSALHEVEQFVYRPLCDIYVKDKVKRLVTRLGAVSEIISDAEAMNNPEGVLADDVVLVGSPFGNTFAKYLYERAAAEAVPDAPSPLKETFSLEAGQRALVDRSGAVYSAPDPVTCDGTSRTEYALIARYENPWTRLGQDAYIYVLAGLHAMGTWAIADFLGNLRHVRHIADEASEGAATLLELEYCTHDPYRYRYELVAVHALSSLKV